MELVAVRAPFHDGSQRDYLRALTRLDNHVGMLAATAGLVAALTHGLRDDDRRRQPVRSVHHPDPARARARRHERTWIDMSEVWGTGQRSWLLEVIYRGRADAVPMCRRE